MIRSRSSLLIATAAALLTVSPAVAQAATPPVYRHAREVPVATPGWVRVPHVLATLAEPLPVASSDLAAVADQLAAYPAVETKLVEPALTPVPVPPTVVEPVARWGLVLALAVASVVLLAVLAGVLRSPEGGS